MEGEGEKWGGVGGGGGGEGRRRGVWGVGRGGGMRRRSGKRGVGGGWGGRGGRGRGGGGGGGEVGGGGGGGGGRGGGAGAEEDQSSGGGAAAPGREAPRALLLIEFGPQRDDSRSASAWVRISQRTTSSSLAGGGQSHLFPLRSWQLRKEDEDEVESLNDLAVDAEGRVHAISSLSRCLYQLHPGASTRSSRRNRGGGCRIDRAQRRSKARGAGLWW